LQTTTTGRLALAALGVVFGDIGTSPLYALSAVFYGQRAIPTTSANVLGIISLILWALIAVVCVKYLAVVLRADNEGDGGTLALTGLAMGVTRPGSRLRAVVAMLGIVGTGLFFGDGVVTPAISVLSAVEGLEVVEPGLRPVVVPLAVAVLVALFLLQRRGTERVGVLFGPVMALWFAAIAVLGVANIVREPHVLLAVNPLAGLAFVAANPWLGFIALGGVVLALTGAEALFADMGTFGRRPIWLAWYLVVFPAILLEYFGQGALLLQDPSAARNPFFLGAPRWGLYPLIGLATAATVIASQAVISGAHTVMRHAIHLEFAPRMLVTHTSAAQPREVYLPAVNWLLLVAVVGLVLTFRTANSLAAAFGIAVTGTMTITSALMVVVMHRLWHWGLVRSLAIAGAFMVLDLSLFSANLTKIPSGGWIPLAIAATTFTVLATWRRGRQLLRAHAGGTGDPLERFAGALATNPPPRVPGSAVFLSLDPTRAPVPLQRTLRLYGALHEVVVVATVDVAEVATVPEQERARIVPLPANVFSVGIRYGYMDRVDVPGTLAGCTTAGLPFDAARATYFIGPTNVVPHRHGGMSYWRQVLYAFLDRNANRPAAYFHLPLDRIIWIETQVEL